MKTTLKLTGGGSVVINPMPFAGTVHVMHLVPGQQAASFEIPADLAGVFAQAIECAALTVEGGKRPDCPAHIPMRCPDPDKYLAKYVSKTPEMVPGPGVVL